jgi:hypothetical protein
VTGRGAARSVTTAVLVLAVAAVLGPLFYWASMYVLASVLAG